MNDIELWHGDCMTELFRVEDGSVDAIICDLPFGVTACKWDQVIPMNDYVQVGKKRLERDDWLLECYLKGVVLSEAKTQWEAEKQIGLWTHYKRVLKPRGAVVLFGARTFSMQLWESNTKWYRYSWVWKKNRQTGMGIVKYRPMMCTEDILVFYKQFGTYNRQPAKSQITDRKLGRSNGKLTAKNYPTMNISSNRIVSASNPNNILKKKVNPRNLLEFKTVPNATGTLCPTQKPLALLEYLIRTYTNPNDLILDNCAGSATTLHAALNTGRRAIGIEKERKYYETGLARLEKAYTTPRQLSLDTQPN